MTWFQAASVALFLLVAPQVADAQQPAQPSNHVSASDARDSGPRDTGNPNALRAVTVLTAFLGGMAFFYALIRQAFEHRRWQRSVQVQSQLHARLIEQLTAREDFRGYLESSSGRRLLEAMTTISPGAQTPAGRVLWSVQAGVILSAVGVGLWVARRAITDSDVLVAFDVVSTLAIVTGIGFVLSAAVSWVLLRRLGLMHVPQGEP